MKFAFKSNNITCIPSNILKSISKGIFCFRFIFNIVVKNAFCWIRKEINQFYLNLYLFWFGVLSGTVQKEMSVLASKLFPILNSYDVKPTVK